MKYICKDCGNEFDESVVAEVEDGYQDFCPHCHSIYFTISDSYKEKRDRYDATLDLLETLKDKIDDTSLHLDRNLDEEDINDCGTDLIESLKEIKEIISNEIIDLQKIK